MSGTANYPSFLDFRLDKDGPLSWKEMDNMFRKPNIWESGTEFEVGMICLWDDSLDPVGATNGALSFWQCNTDNIGATQWAPGTTYGYWTRIGTTSATLTGGTGATGPTGPIGTQGIQGIFGPQGIQGLE